MKKWISILSIVTILIVVVIIIYKTTNNTPMIKNKNIKKITISIYGGDKFLRTTENKSEIADIVKHMNGLHLKRTNEKVNEYSGSSFVITLYFDNKSSKEYVEFGNMFFKEPGKGWYRIPYKEADKFTEFYNRLEEK